MPLGDLARRLPTQREVRRWHRRKATVKETVAFSRFPSVLEQSGREIRRVCAEVCPSDVPKANSPRAMQSTRPVAFSVKGDALNGGRFQRVAVERFA
jgi:hypothetical protein